MTNLHCQFLPGINVFHALTGLLKYSDRLLSSFHCRANAVNQWDFLRKLSGWSMLPANRQAA